MAILSAAGTTCFAGIVPLVNQSSCTVRSQAGNVTDSDTESATGLSWSSGVASFAYTPDLSSTALARIDASTEMASDVISGSCGGGCTGAGSAVNSGTCRMFLRFRVDVCQDIAISSSINPGTLSNTFQEVKLFDRDLDTYLDFDTPGQLLFARLSPGTYVLQGANWFPETSESGDLSLLSMSMTFDDCANPLITTHPVDLTGTQGSAAQFSVGTSPPGPSPAGAAVGPTTYQWRKNLVNLIDGGRISGATTAQLAITDISAFDTGKYDVVVTRDGIVERSSYANLWLSGTASIDPAHGAGGLAFEAPSPNPFGKRVGLRFVLPRAAQARLEILDVSGRRVATLLDSPLAAGAHTAEWNGRTAGGSRADAGVYFARLVAENQLLVRRVVLMPLAP